MSGSLFSPSWYRVAALTPRIRSHAQILRMYADVAYFGHGYYGLAAASCGYFGKGPARLSWGQAAMLAAIARAPGADDPFVPPAQVNFWLSLVPTKPDDAMERPPMT